MKKIFTSILLSTLCTAAVWAIPANPKAFKHQQPDGTTLTLRLVGDEYMHYYLNEADGTRLELREDGHYYPIANDQIQEMQAQAASRREAAQERRSLRMGQPQVNGPRKTFGQPTAMSGKKKGIVILVNFADKAMRSDHGQEAFDDMFNKEGYNIDEHIGSVSDYFKEQSYGKFELTFDVVGPVTLSNNMSYYGGNDYSGSDKRPAQMIKDACNLVKSKVNFADYDWDNDGYVDQVFVIYAGHGENYTGSDPNTIWPHEWDLTSAGIGTLTLNGKKINTYACCAELYGTQSTDLNGIGTACHEFSHCLGYPDTYDIDYSGGIGMDAYDVMCGGSYNGPNGRGEVPCGYTSYQRWMAGWLEPEIISEPTNVTDMPALNDEGSAYIIFNEKNTNEYFLLENRQSRGWFQYFDYNIAGHGLFITHVDENTSVWKNNKPNDDPNHQRMTWVPADKYYGTYDKTDKYWSISASEAQGDFFPGTDQVSYFYPTDWASYGGKWFNKDTDGTYFSSHSLSKITESNGKISFLADGGDDGSRYTVTFHAGSGECKTTSWTQTASSRESVKLPVATIDSEEWSFAGWSTSSISETVNKPATLLLGESYYTPTSDVNLYAVYKNVSAGGESGSYTLDYTAENNLQKTSMGYGKQVEYTATDGGQWVIKAYKNNGMQLNKGKDASIKVPLCPNTIREIEVTTSAAKVLKFASSDYTGGYNTSAVATSSASLTPVLDLTGMGLFTGYIYTTDGATVISRIEVRYGASSTIYWATEPSIVALPTPTIAFLAPEDKALCVGDTYTNTVKVEHSTGLISYESSDPAIVSVNASGTVSALAVGEVTITATVASVKGESKAAHTSYKVTVSMPQLKESTLIQQPAKLVYNESETFDPAGMLLRLTFVNGYQKEISSGFTFPTAPLTPATKSIMVTYTEGEVICTMEIFITVNPLPRYTIIFEPGTGSCVTQEETQASYQGEITLPEAVAGYQGWTFEGWSTEKLSAATTTKPSVLLLAGSKYTPSEDVTLYAVYAKRDGEGENWKRVDLNATIEEGIYALVTPDGHAFSGSIDNGHGKTTSDNFSIDAQGNAGAVAPQGTCLLSLAITSTGYTLYNENKGYLYAKAAKSGNLAWGNASNLDYSWTCKSGDWKYASNAAFLRAYDNGSFRTYKDKSGTEILLLKQNSLMTITYAHTPEGSSSLSAIETLAPASMRAFTLDGKAADTQQPGFYITNGRKVVILNR